MIPQKKQTSPLPPPPPGPPTPAKLQPKEDTSFQHSLHSLPLEDAENVIPIKDFLTPQKSGRRTPLLAHSPVPDLTPPLESDKTLRVYEALLAPKRTVLSPLALEKRVRASRHRVVSASKPFRLPLRAASARHGLRRLSMGVKSEALTKYHALASELDVSIERMRHQNQILQSYGDLGLSEAKTVEKDAFLVEKWQAKAEKLSQIVLERYKKHILEKNGSFKAYKLSKYDEYRKKLRRTMLSELEDKYEEIIRSQEYQELLEYERKSVDSEYKEVRSKTIDEMERQCDAKFKEMFANDIAKQGRNNRLANSEQDVLDEFEMKDMYRDLKLDYKLVFTK